MLLLQIDTYIVHTSRLCSGYLTKKESDEVMERMLENQSRSLLMKLIEVEWQSQLQCANLLSKPKGAILKNPKCKTYSVFFEGFFTT